ncbi:MAG: hypothetical protein KAY65_10000 [Planctomycetes bacterium]|nr:hypothetical protein [Planctomycetota bacterium]
MIANRKSRWTFLKTSGLAAAALATHLGLWAASKAKRPNIVWISTEDIGRRLGCYDNPDAITPALRDRCVLFSAQPFALHLEFSLLRHCEESARGGRRGNL